mgnify:CR=1 FL=1
MQKAKAISIVTVGKYYLCKTIEYPMKEQKNALHSPFHLDKMAIIITIFYYVIIIACGIRPFIEHVVIIEILMIVLFLLPIFIWPIRLTVSDKEIKVFRLIGWFKVSVADVNSVVVIEDGKQFFNKLIRTFGSGGVYGYLGWFKHEKYGKIRMFATDMEQCFLLKLKNDKVIVISSPKRQEITNLIKQSTK